MNGRELTSSPCRRVLGIKLSSVPGTYFGTYFLTNSFECQALRNARSWAQRNL